MSANDTQLRGVATRSGCPMIVLKGNAYQRGFQYGKAFARHLSNFYDWFVRVPIENLLSADYRRVLEGFEDTMMRHYPVLFEEIKGVGDGSGMGYDACRVLAFHNDVRPLLAPGCSNVMTTRGPDGPWLGRTCDLGEDERRWQVFKQCYCDDGLSYAGTTYLGLVACCLGVNSAGLVVGGSSSSSSTPPVPGGLACSALVLLATCRTTADACRLAREVGFTGKGANMATLDAEGHGAGIEYAPGIVAIREPDATGFLACTNHSVTGKIPPPGVAKLLPNSKARQEHLAAIVGQADPSARTVALAKRALADHEGEHHVCQHIPNSYHTIYSWIIQPGKTHSVLHFNWGYPCEDRYFPIYLHW